MGLTGYALAAAAAVCLAMSGALWWQSGRIDTLTADKATLTRSMAALQMQADQSALAREVERARAEAAAVRNAALATKIETILTGGIPDAPLHPDLVDLLNGRNVRPH